MKIDYNKHIWEELTVLNFINALSGRFNFIIFNGYGKKPFQSRKELKQWCIDNQPYYKKYIPEVVNHFNATLKLK